MKETIVIEKAGSVKSVYSGRVIGVLGAVLSSGLDMLDKGVKYSNVSGLVVGSATGYYLGNVSDKATDVINQVTGANNSGIIPAIMCGGMAYGVASGFRGLGRRFDDTVDEKVGEVTDWYQNRSTDVDTTATDAVSLF